MYIPFKCNWGDNTPIFRNKISLYLYILYKRTFLKSSTYLNTTCSSVHVSVKWLKNISHGIRNGIVFFRYK